MSADMYLTGYTASGDDIELYVEQDASVSYVSITSADFGYIQFNFNPDFPDDAKKCFLAFCELRSIEFEERS